MSTRTSRRMPEETKYKISQALQGKTKTEEHKRKIAEAMKAYWRTIPE